MNGQTAAPSLVQPESAGPAPTDPAPRTGPADLIVSAGTIHTLDDERPVAESIAIRGGVIVAVGSPAETEQWAGPKTRRAEHPGSTIVPGLTDCHVHVLMGLDLVRGVDLTDRDRNGVLGLLREAEVALGPGEWLLGWGLDPNVFTAGEISGRLFDGFSRPVAARMRDGHSAVANAAALAAAGVTGRERLPGTASVVVDAAGSPTGYLLEAAAMDLVTGAAPAPSPDEELDGLLAVLEGMAATGITSAHALDFGDGTGELLRRAEERAELPVRLRISPICWPGAGDDEIERIIALQGSGGRRWCVEGVKLFIDGTVDNGTAWLDEPDVYGENAASVWHSPEDYERTLHRFIRAGLWTTTHAIGDGGVRRVLDAIERSGSAGPHRIEHIETLPDDLVPRFARLGVAASMQPVHATHHTRADQTDNWSVRVGLERTQRGWRCRDLREAGAVLALGTDWPITPYDARALMADARLRRPAGRPEVTPVQPDQALTALMALEGYTTHAALSIGGSQGPGRITPGAPAHLTVFGGDILELDPDDAARVDVVATYVDGVRAR
ncbi:amidohydrolase [Sinomonas sp. ASV322]|uniref:amidohydrolase n=1 Tax=Sinomonas sp. ASV322 TaxID=3041920 RepID=UPI0027DE3148|nr:amidohydrolase [Sinomonas sp. ASV322]MDQ4504566.1 amidohydrolase [Sinomonas sp. ASV322]